MDGMAIRVDDQQFILPLSNVVEAITVEPDTVSQLPDRTHVVRLRDEFLPVFSLRSVLSMPETDAESSTAIVIDTETSGHIVVLVDDLLGQRQVVLKSLEGNVGQVEGVGGATILGDGKVALVLDVAALFRPRAEIRRRTRKDALMPIAGSDLMDAPSGGRESNADARQFVTFVVEGRTYGIPIGAVREIIRWTRVTPLPNQPHHARGVLNLRGTIVPVHDLRAKLSGSADGRERHARHRHRQRRGADARHPRRRGVGHPQRPGRGHEGSAAGRRVAGEPGARLHRGRPARDDPQPVGPVRIAFVRHVLMAATGRPATLDPSSAEAPAPGGEFVLTAEDLRRITARGQQTLGIELGEGKRQMIYSRLSRRLRALRMTSFRDLSRFSRQPGGRGRARAVRQRADDQPDGVLSRGASFRAFRARDRARRARESRRLRVWSAGCSTGEEPYSLAMALHANADRLGTRDRRILATDLDTGVLAKAATATYPVDRFKALPPRFRAPAFLDPAAAGEQSVSAPVRALVTFRALNLIGPWPLEGTVRLRVLPQRADLFLQRDARPDDRPLRRPAPSGRRAVPRPFGIDPRKPSEARRRGPHHLQAGECHELSVRGHSRRRGRRQRADAPSDHRGAVRGARHRRDRLGLRRGGGARADPRVRSRRGHARRRDAGDERARFPAQDHGAAPDAGHHGVEPDGRGRRDERQRAADRRDRRGAEAAGQGGDGGVRAAAPAEGAAGRERARDARAAPDGGGRGARRARGGRPGAARRRRSRGA